MTTKAKAIFSLAGVLMGAALATGAAADDTLRGAHGGASAANPASQDVADPAVFLKQNESGFFSGSFSHVFEKDDDRIIAAIGQDEDGRSILLISKVQSGETVFAKTTETLTAEDLSAFYGKLAEVLGPDVVRQSAAASGIKLITEPGEARE